MSRYPGSVSILSLIHILEAVAKAFSNPSDSVFPRILFLIVSYAVCIMSTEYVGFFVTNAVFCMIYIFFFLERGLIRIVLTPLLLLGVIYGIVVFFLNYPLPSGIPVSYTHLGGPGTFERSFHLWTDYGGKRHGICPYGSQPRH